MAESHRSVHSTVLACVIVAVSAAPAPGRAVQRTREPADSGWIVQSQPHVDLWFHGLAVVGFIGTGEFPLYSPEYATRMRAAKQELGVYPTELDKAAEKLLSEFENDDTFQVLHFVPLYFSSASREEMLLALTAVAERRTMDSTVIGPSTESGARTMAATLREGNQRKVLGQFVEALEQEWEVFFGQYWERTIAADSGHYTEIQQRWSEDVAPALAEFLTGRELGVGKLFVSPALGPEGRLSGNVVAVWSPLSWDDPDASVFAAVRELCFSIVSEAVQDAGTVSPAEEQDVGGRAAVRCGSLLFEEYAPDLVARYQAIFLRALGAEGEGAGGAFEEAYPVDETVLGGLRDRIEPGAAEAAPKWVVRAAPQTDLWFHALAVIAADEPGPLGLYSADYARHIREVKRELGVYPTMLDSLGPDLREGIADDEDLQQLHFVPLYFPRTKPERLIKALRAVAKRRTDDPELFGRDVGFGIRVMSQGMRRGSARRLLESLVDAVEQEWHVFYREYWERMHEEQKPRYAAIQSMWDSLFAPQLGDYLGARRLTAGLIMPSPGLGPEGRIVDLDSFDPEDQVVAVQLPVSTDRPEATVFAFLKELCFLLVDARVFRDITQDEAELDDLRRRAAVRCGAMLLDFYAPILVGRYRRAFLVAVGAEESSTVAAFERVYALDPEVLELVREQVRRRR